MKAVIYTRVSSDEQIDGTSLAFQREDCLRYAQENEFAVVEVFEERGESAKFADRPQLQRLLAFCKERGRSLDALIVWKLDRLSRNQMDYYYIKRTLFEHGIAIHSATERSLDDPNSLAGRVFETFTALQAEVDNSVRRERVIRGMAAKIREGIYPWYPPLGYCCARNRMRGLKKLEPDQADPERFQLVQRLLRTCLDQEICGTTELAALGSSWGLTSRNGKKLYPQHVDRILGNKFYAGILVDPWSGEEYTGRHRPMLTPDEFDRVVWLRSGKRGATLRRSAEHPDFPLRRTVLCGGCQAPLTGSWSRGNGGRYAYYHCARKSCPNYGKGMPKKSFESGFTDLLRRCTPKKLTVGTFSEAVLDVWARKRSWAHEHAQTEAGRALELETRLDSLIDMRAKGLLSDDEFLPRKEAIRAERADLKHRSDLETIQLSDRPTVVREAAGRILAYPRNWRTLPPRKRRRFEKIVFPEGVSYSRESGFRTTKTGLCYEVMWRSHGSKSRMVHLVTENWNQLLEELKNMGRDIDIPDRPDEGHGAI